MLKDKGIQSVMADRCIKESFSGLDRVNVNSLSRVQGDGLNSSLFQMSAGEDSLKSQSGVDGAAFIEPASLDVLEADVQKITNILVELVVDDMDWWRENIESLASQPLDSLQLHLTRFQDSSLSGWNFKSKNDISCSILDPLEALTWLAGICRLDRILIGALPREFVDQYELQWKVLALYWV